MAKIPIHAILEKALGVSEITSEKQLDALLADKEKMKQAVDEINKLAE